MKKYYFMMAAVSAMMLTACTSEDDVLLADKAQPTVENSAVGFDVYVPAATQTRSGLEGTMTTGRLQRTEAYGGGFGVYAYQVQDKEKTAGDGANATAYNAASPGTPNFMVNEKILWNSVNQGWYYNPLKYWPNETDNDSQTSPAQMETLSTGSDSEHHLDRLSFFAYAPYVPSIESGTVGIVGKTAADGKLYVTSSAAEGSDPDGVGEASIKYKASIDDANKAVDLLWGVAPAGGLTYTAVNGRTVTVKEGMPLVDMTKPDVNTNMKFLFQHALARIGIKAVAAIDQVGAGGTLDPNTKITIDKITLTGYFGTTGILDLNNPKASVANWTYLNGVKLVGDDTHTKVDDIITTKSTFTLSANQTTPDNGSIATHLQFIGDGTKSLTDPKEQKDRLGVTTVKQDVFQPSTVKHCVSSITPSSEAPLYYSESTPYYTTWTKDAGSSVLASAALANGTYYKYGQDGSWTEEATTNETYKYPEVIVHYEAVGDGTDVFKEITTTDLATQYANYTAYTRSGSTGSFKYTPVADVPEKDKGHFVLVKTMVKAKPAYANGTPLYKRDANFFMVIPTNNVANLCTKLTDTKELEKLRTVRVKIEYYITTEDSKLGLQRAQTRNVIEKDVVFPSLANGKSYNLNLILGLTSVKMEAEVDDWKVINVNADLPQNTAE